MKMNEQITALTTVIACVVLLSVSRGARAAEGKPNSKPADSSIQGEEVAVLTFAPNVPPPIKRTHATKLKVELEVKEVTRKLADGVGYVFWTFGGEVPGKFIRIREGDQVEFHLLNDT